jgi:hypothetical protein
MPGQLGNVQTTIQNLTIVKIMPEENIMLVKGSVPGHKGSIVIIKPTQKKYTPKEIYTETDIPEVETKTESTEANQTAEAITNSKQDSMKTEQATDDTTQKQTNHNSDKE